MSKVIIGTGSDLPERVITNDDLEQMVEDYDRERAGGMSLNEWVMKRTGVRLRHRLLPGEGTSDMATRAAQRALSDAGLTANDLDLIVMSTVTSDHRLPQSAALVQKNLDCRCKFFQLEHACAGFVDAVIVAGALMDIYGYRTALVVSSEAGSAILDPKRFMNQTVFGDGAGAVILQERDAPGYGVQATYTASDGSIAEWTWVPAGGTKIPITPEVTEKGLQYLVVDFKNVYPFAVEKMIESTREVLKRANVRLDEIDFFIPHQTGRNIILDAARQMEIPEEKVIMNLDHTGNTSGASIPLAVDEANRAGCLKDGAKVVLPAIGGGMAWGALYLVWYDRRLHEDGKQ
jgi:3-oxoacyl-[acyl-carrier-protein] synthase-3